MTWTLDPHHTSVSFSAKHLGVATVRGSFNHVEADLDLDDPADPTTGRGRVVIDAGSIDTGDERRDGHLRNADFFDADTYPQLVFEVKSVRPARDDTYTVVGDLTIKDVTREITLNYEHNGSVVDPMGNVKVGGTLSGSINRSDWGLTWNVPLAGGRWLVSDTVKLEIDGELTQVKMQAREDVAA